MQRLLFLFALTLSLTPVVAQLTAPQVLHGDTVYQDVLEALALALPAEDGSTVWDATAVAVLDQTMSAVSTAALTPWGKSFPNAAFGMNAAGTSTYYSFSEGSTYYGGVQGGVVVVYSDPEVYMPLPFGPEIGQVWTDEFSAAFVVDGEETVRSGNVTATYRGTGTLNLASGEVLSDIHMVDLQEVIVDTLPSGWVYTAELNSRQLLDGVFFVSRLSSVEIVETLYDEAGEVLDGATTNFGLQLTDYVMDVPLAASNQPARFALFPNPARSGAPMTIVWPALAPGPSSVAIADASGREVWRDQVWPGAQATTFVLPADLAPGTYILRASGNAYVPQSFVIQP